MAYLENDQGRPARPLSVERSERPCTEACARQCKMDVALSLIQMLAELRRPHLVMEQEDHRMVCAALMPKEEACYMAALDCLERYMDSQDY